MDGPCIATVEGIFRDANEAIADAAREVEFTGSPPFVCECRDRRCHEVVQIPLDEYVEIRSDPTHFLVLPGHEGPSGIVREARGYVVVAVEAGG
jgi:hypothetical protein